MTSVPKKINSIYIKIIDVQSKVSGIKRNTKAYNYNYENLDSIINLLHPHLTENKLCVVNNIEPLDENSYVCITSIFDELGNSIESKCPIVGAGNILVKGNPMQGMGSAITYARRYNLKNLFNLFSTDDDAASLAVKVASDKQVELIESLLGQVSQSINMDSFHKFIGTTDIATISVDKAKATISMLQKKVQDAK